MSDSAETDNNRQIIYRTYIDERKSLVDAEHEQAKLFDRSAITLASGALGLSLSFVGQIVGHKTPQVLYLLWFAWSLLLVSLLATLASFRFGVHAFQRQRKILDSENDAEPTAVLSGNCWSILVEVSNTVSLVSIVIGISLLAAFIGQNTFE